MVFDHFFNGKLFSNQRRFLQNEIPMFDVSLIQLELSFHAQKLIHIEFAWLDLEGHFGDRFWSCPSTKEALTVGKLGQNYIGISVDVYGQIISLQRNFLVY